MPEQAVAQVNKMCVLRLQDPHMQAVLVPGAYLSQEERLMLARCWEVGHMATVCQSL